MQYHGNGSCLLQIVTISYHEQQYPVYTRGCELFDTYNVRVQVNVHVRMCLLSGRVACNWPSRSIVLLSMHGLYMYVVRVQTPPPRRNRVWSTWAEFSGLH